MLGFIEGQLCEFQPVLEAVDLSASLIDSRVHVFAGGEKIVAGVRYYVMSEDPGLDVAMNKETGEFAVTKGYGQAVLRAVVGTQHFDLSLNVVRAAANEGPSVA